MNKGTFEVVKDVPGQIIEVSTITSHGRVQVPSVIRKALRIKDGDRVFWVKNRSGEYCLCKSE